MSACVRHDKPNSLPNTGVRSSTPQHHLGGSPSRRDNSLARVALAAVGDSDGDADGGASHDDSSLEPASPPSSPLSLLPLPLLEVSSLVLRRRRRRRPLLGRARPGDNKEEEEETPSVNFSCFRRDTVAVDRAGVPVRRVGATVHPSIDTRTHARPPAHTHTHTHTHTRVPEPLSGYTRVRAAHTYMLPHATHQLHHHHHLRCDLCSAELTPTSSSLLRCGGCDCAVLANADGACCCRPPHRSRHCRCCHLEEESRGAGERLACC